MAGDLHTISIRRDLKALQAKSPHRDEYLTNGILIALFLCERSKTMKTKTNVKAGMTCCSGVHYKTVTLAM